MGGSLVGFLHALVEQDLICFRASFADAEDIDGGIVVDGAGVFTSATADALRGIDPGLLDLFGIAARIDNFGGIHVDGLGRGGAPLFANDAIGSHGPGEAAAMIIEGGADADGLGVRSDVYGPALFFWSDLPDCSGGADLRAEDATGFAIAYAGDEDRCPYPFQASLCERRLKGIVGADLHAFAATDAAGEEIGFFEGARRTDQAIVFLCGEGGGAA